MPQIRPTLAFDRPPIVPPLASISRRTRVPITHANGAEETAHHDAEDPEDQDRRRLWVVGSDRPVCRELRRAVRHLLNRRLGVGVRLAVRAGLAVGVRLGRAPGLWGYDCGYGVVGGGWLGSTDGGGGGVSLMPSSCQQHYGCPMIDRDLLTRLRNDEEDRFVALHLGRPRWPTRHAVRSSPAYRCPG